MKGIFGIFIDRVSRNLYDEFGVESGKSPVIVHHSNKHEKRGIPLWEEPCYSTCQNSGKTSHTCGNPKEASFHEDCVTLPYGCKIAEEWVEAKHEGQ